MSKITKALDRAKEQRGGITGEPARRAAAQPKPEQVSYTQTQVVEQPVTPLDAGRMLSHVDDPALADYYSLLRTQVLHQTRDKGHNIIMVTSVGKGEGKTLTAINLAISMAKESVQTALLVDTNLRDPKVAEYLGLTTSKGLADYMLDDAPMPSLLINPGMKKLVVLPAGRPISGATEILGSPKMRNLVREMKSKYPERYVIFDCPHLLDMPDALVFTSLVDQVLLVVEAGKTTRRDIRRTMELLQGRNLLGIVMNKVPRD
ncbi:MAG: AAA family ATPase [Proteobacteria bacterium]|nr:AAA family ATPase [Pseudomonadota bacterium]MBU1595312.1 AAA family ATPase [Pseudomonadota bacterium]